MLGFCERNKIDTSGMITLFFQTREEVDEMHEKLEKTALQDPSENQKYKIYQFYARDPENRMIECQCFLHDLNPYLTGEQLLVTRRSVRTFRETPVPKQLLDDILEICRYSPTSRNSQAYYYIVIDKEKNKDKVEFLSSRREKSSEPIKKAPLAVAVCVDTGNTSRPEQDGCIAAYHFILASWQHGLGTCWIAAMDREDVKETLGIPTDHYVATVTPLGYPENVRSIPDRRKVDEFTKFI